MSQAPVILHLKPATLQAFLAYAHEAEEEMNSTLQPEGRFLWCEQDEKRNRRVLSGSIEAQFWRGTKPLSVPDGLIHDWMGDVFVPGATVAQTLRLVQNYDNYKNVYKPEVLDSKLISHDGNDFKIYLRILKKKVLTVVADTDHDVRYSECGPRRWLCRSYTTRIAEVENAGTPREKVMPADVGYGFMWRLYSYWRFEEKNEGVYLECRAMSLTRDMPFGLGWIIEPIIRKLPQESLIHTLEATRTALQKS